MDEIDLTPDEERVFAAASAVEAAGGGYAQEVAREAGLPEDRTRQVLSRLVHRDLLVEDATELAGDPDLGPRYRVRARPS